MTTLITARRDRVLAAMADRDIDVLVLGRQDDANYATGMHRLWTAGTRPFGAGCVVVRSTGRTHVLSGWDAGLPETMTWDDLYPSTWNPRVMSGYLSAIPGLTDARRIGVDEVSPSFERAAARLAAGAEIVPADDLMASVRRHKLPAEIELIRAACATAWRAAQALSADGASDATVVAALGQAGATIPSSAPILHTDGGVTTFDIGIILNGYEGGCSGTVGETTELPALVDACRAGADHRSLAHAAGETGWLIRGLGMGFERPVIDSAHGKNETLSEGMVVSVSDGRTRNIVAVTDAAPDVLSARPKD